MAVTPIAVTRHPSSVSGTLYTTGGDATANKATSIIAVRLS